MLESAADLRFANPHECRRGVTEPVELTTQNGLPFGPYR
jgi:hypothetical protein